MINFTERELEILHHLVATEMDGICGDLGYLELSGIIKKIRIEKDIKRQEKS